jgi:hypothetical protein
MFTAKEKDELLIKIMNGNLDNPPYTYATADIRERQVCRILNRDGYIRRSESEHETACFMTEKGVVFVSWGGYRRQFYRNLLDDNKLFVVSFMGLIITLFAFLRGCQ